MNDVPNDLKMAYIKSARTKMVILNQLWDIAVRTNWTPQVAQTLLEFIFRIKGSGGSYGYQALSDAADRLYRLLNEAELSNTRLSTSTVNQARRALEQELKFVARPLRLVRTTTEVRQAGD